MYQAASSGDVDRVQQLLDEGAGLDHVVEAWTPILSAASRGHEQVVLPLAEAGADLSVQEESGWTVLHFAVCPVRPWAGAGFVDQPRIRPVHGR